MTRCSVCHRWLFWILPWVHFGQRDGKRWHARCKPHPWALMETPIAMLYERQGRLVLRRRQP